MGEPLALGDMHFGIPAKIPAKSPALRRIGRLCASVSPPSSHFHSDAARAEILPFSANGGRLFRGTCASARAPPMRGRGIAHGWIERHVDTIGFARVLSGSSLRTNGSGYCRPDGRLWDPSPLASKVKKGLCSSAKTRFLAVWVPAFAGTTRRNVTRNKQGSCVDRIENSICDSPTMRGAGLRACCQGLLD
jgi:hypothetical protein